MKLKLSYTIDADSPSDWASEEWKLTYSSKDDMVLVLRELSKVVSDFKEKHSQVKTQFELDRGWNNGGLELTCLRKLSDSEKVELKKKMKENEARRLRIRKREIKAEAKKLGLL